jgi:hypothetical protein
VVWWYGASYPKVYLCGAHARVDGEYTRMPLGHAKRSCASRLELQARNESRDLTWCCVLRFICVGCMCVVGCLCVGGCLCGGGCLCVGLC